MNLYQRLGYLVLGSRLRRLSETFIAELVQAYRDQGIAFEAAWFPVFYLLSAKKELSIKALADETEVSHPAASQLVATLRKKGLVHVRTSKADGRKQLVALTPDGEALLEQVRPVWTAVLVAMEELTSLEPGAWHLLDTLSALEKAFEKRALSEMINEKLQQLQHG